MTEPYGSVERESEGPNTALYDLHETRFSIHDTKHWMHQEEVHRKYMRALLASVIPLGAIVAVFNWFNPPNTPLLWIDGAVVGLALIFLGYGIYYLSRRSKKITELRVNLAKLREAERDARLRIPREASTRLMWTYHSDVMATIEEYRESALGYRRVHNRFQSVIIIGSLLTTAITTASAQFQGVEWVAALVSFFVGISAGMTGYFKFRERSMNLQQAADELDREYKAVELGIRAYRDRNEEERLVEFAERAEDIKDEQRKREQQLEQPPEARGGRDNLSSSS